MFLFKLQHLLYCNIMLWGKITSILLQVSDLYILWEFFLCKSKNIFMLFLGLFTTSKIVNAIQGNDKSLLDNAPNYLVGCVIQKRFNLKLATFGSILGPKCTGAAISCDDKSLLLLPFSPSNVKQTMIISYCILLRKEKSSSFSL